MISRELLKDEIDNIKREEYLVILHRIIQSRKVKPSQFFSKKRAKTDTKSEWHQFIEATYGSLSDAPIKRGAQGVFEVREVIELVQVINKKKLIWRLNE